MPTPAPAPSGSQLKVNMVLARLPRLRSGADPTTAFAGTFHVDESAAQLDAAYAQAAAGRLPDVIPFEVYCHSLTDPSILGPVERATGQHTLTLFGLHTPAELYRDDPVGPRREAVRRVVAQLDAHLEEPLLDCLARDAAGDPCLQAASPLDVEASLAMPGGHIFHGDLSWPVAATPDQVGTWGAATDHPRIVAASSGGTVRGGARQRPRRLRGGPTPAGPASPGRQPFGGQGNPSGSARRPLRPGRQVGQTRQLRATGRVVRRIGCRHGSGVGRRRGRRGGGSGVGSV